MELLLDSTHDNLKIEGSQRWQRGVGLIEWHAKHISTTRVHSCNSRLKLWLLVRCVLFLQANLDSSQNAFQNDRLSIIH
eukprot:3056160-Amphidinium_carterae.1